MNRNAGLTITVPADGEVVLAAASYGDWEFQGTGGSAGTYRLTIREVPVAHAVAGRIVDAVSGRPLPDATVSLLTCDAEGSCYNYAGTTSVDTTGSFRFENGFYNLYGPLLTGSYQIIVEALGHEAGTEGPFQLTAGQELNVGDIALQTVPAVGSISGRLVDEITGQPLTGNPWVELQYCPSWGCYGRETQYVGPDGTLHPRGRPGPERRRYHPPGGAGGRLDQRTPARRDHRPAALRRRGALRPGRPPYLLRLGLLLPAGAVRPGRRDLPLRGVAVLPYRPRQVPDCGLRRPVPGDLRPDLRGG